MEDMIDRLPAPSYEWTLDDWCNIAQLLGQKDEEAYVSDEQEAALREIPEEPRRPWAPFRKVGQGRPAAAEPRSQELLPPADGGKRT